MKKINLNKHNVTKGVFLLVFTLLCNLGVSAQTSFTIGSLKYTTTSDSTVSVAKNGTPVGKLVIPASVQNGSVLFSVTVISNSAFSFCTSLTSVVIPNSVTTIESFAFRGCSSLTSITIPSSVSTLGAHAFWGSSALKNIYCYIEEPLSVGALTFGNVPESCVVHVPAGCKIAYKNTNYWNKFNIVEDLPTGIISIDNSQLTNDNDVWYTLNGTRLNGKPTKAGVYIVNGKKVVIK